MKNIDRLLEKARQFKKEGNGQALCLVSPAGGGLWEAAATAFRHGQWEAKTSTHDSRDKALLWGRGIIGDNGQMIIDDIEK